MVATTHSTRELASLPGIRKVSLLRPLHWLRRGTADLGECAPANRAPMLLWAALITAIAVAGFATLLLGFVVLMPLLGHATWHAYRDLVE